MKFTLCLILVAASLSFGQIENWNGYGDTAKITGFFSTNTVYSGWFRLSAFSRVRHAVYLNDTSSAGYANDSINAMWGIQTGCPSFLTTSNTKRKMILGRKIVFDTFNIAASNVFTGGLSTIDNAGYPVFTWNKIDTLIDSMGTSVRSPYAYQSVSPLQEFDVYYRYWITGLTGNKGSNKLIGYFQSARETGIKVKTND